MSQENQITLRGFVTAEPRFRQTNNARVSVAEIRVGSAPRRLNRTTGEWYDTPATYYTVKCWRQLAINVMASVRKGDMILVRGRFYLNSWVDKETQQPRSAIEIEADSVGHDLTYGHAIFTRAGRPRPEDSALGNGGQARQDQDQGEAADDEFPDATAGYPGPADPAPGEQGWAGAPRQPESPESPEGTELGAVPDADLATAGMTGGQDTANAAEVPF